MHKTNTQSYHILLGYVVNQPCAKGKQEDESSDVVAGSVNGGVC